MPKGRRNVNAPLFPPVDGELIDENPALQEWVRQRYPSRTPAGGGLCNAPGLLFCTRGEHDDPVHVGHGVHDQPIGWWTD